MAVMNVADSSPPVAAHQPIDWREQLAQHERWLRQVILARTGESGCVDEIWQQVSLAVVEQRWPLADPARVAPWLHRVAIVLSARYVRQLGRGRRALAAIGKLRQQHAGAVDPLKLLMRSERLEITRKAILRLAGRDAEILLLKYAHRWSYRQIAAHLGITEKAVDCRLLRARERLRLILVEMGIDEEDV